MGKNIIEKILAAHLVTGDLTPGSEIGIRIDQTLTQDATGTMAYLQFEAMGVDRVRTELSASYIDHNTVQIGFENADDHLYLQSVARKRACMMSFDCLAQCGLRDGTPGWGQFCIDNQLAAALLVERDQGIAQPVERRPPGRRVRISGPLVVRLLGRGEPRRLRSVRRSPRHCHQADHSRQGGFSETMGGVLYGLKLGEDPDNPAYIIHAGGFLRWNDALVPVIKLDYAPFSVALSYDVNISKLKPSSYGRGGFEMSVSYIGFLKRNEGYLLCPKF